MCHAGSSFCDELITRSEAPYGMRARARVSNYVRYIHLKQWCGFGPIWAFASQKKKGSISSYTRTQISKDVANKARQRTGSCLPSIKLIFSKYILKGIYYFSTQFAVLQKAFYIVYIVKIPYALPAVQNRNTFSVDR